ncbi:DUF305 domain-containing protein [Actinoplanes sp. NPDC051475]|uniref:DUF305 domain-containing protein n=1 Tax=Actinoplanes sp. NPDC051475 TaxID=3157225 RepID=UPI00344DC9A4
MTRSVVLRRALLAGAAVTATIVLSACGGGDSSSGSGMDHGSGMTPGAPASASGSASPFADADVTFAKMMVVHHRQAIEMAELASTRAADPEVKTLAGKIKVAQQPQIDTMTGWLSAWGSPEPTPVMSGGMAMPDAMSSMGHGGMPGAMSQADMTKLAAARGAAFDKQFLAVMIDHHQGAISMAKLETLGGDNTDAKALAAKIITDQQAEITTMQAMLDRL